MARRKQTCRRCDECSHVHFRLRWNYIGTKAASLRMHTRFFEFVCLYWAAAEIKETFRVRSNIIQALSGWAPNFLDMRELWKSNSGSHDTTKHHKYWKNWALDKPITHSSLKPNSVTHTKTSDTVFIVNEYVCILPRRPPHLPSIWTKTFQFLLNCRLRKMLKEKYCN